MGTAAAGHEGATNATEMAVATVLPGSDIAGLMPTLVAATPTGSGHSRALTAEQILRARSSPHLEMVRSILRASRERSQSRATSSEAWLAPRPPGGGREGSGESGH